MRYHVDTNIGRLKIRQDGLWIVAEREGLPVYRTQHAPHLVEWLTSHKAGKIQPMGN